MSETSIYKKLIEIQGILNVPKTHKNEFGGYNYRNCEDILEAVKPLAHQRNCFVLLSDEVVNLSDRFYVKATATLTDGMNSVSADAYAREDLEKKKSDGSQLTGSASSYARKYALNGLFAIDDTKDADATNNHKESEATKEQLEKIAELAEKLGTDIQTIYNIMCNGQTPNKSQAQQIIPILQDKIEKKS